MFTTSCSYRSIRLVSAHLEERKRKAHISLDQLWEGASSTICAMCRRGGGSTPRSAAHPRPNRTLRWEGTRWKGLD